MAIFSFNEYLRENSEDFASATFKRNSAGIALIYDNKILLAHPTGASWKKASCGIPKGGVEHGEEPLDAALRELMEETGIFLSPKQVDPSPEVVDFFDKNGMQHGQLIYFVCKLESLDEIGLSELSVPKNQLQLEEVDWAKFVSPMEAYSITRRSQLIILDRHLSL